LLPTLLAALPIAEIPELKNPNRRDEAALFEAMNVVS
jgi:hypothetical protein